MNCPKCNNQSDVSALFCRNCGTSLNVVQPNTKIDKKSDLFIMIFISYMVFSEIVRFIVQTMNYSWFESPVKFFIIFLNVIGAFSTVLVALSIRDRTLKITGVIIVSIHMLYILGSNVHWIIR